MRRIDPRHYRCVVCNEDFEPDGRSEGEQKLRYHLRSDKHKEKMEQLRSGSCVMTTFSLHQRYYVAMVVIEGRICCLPVGDEDRPQ